MSGLPEKAKSILAGESAGNGTRTLPLLALKNSVLFPGLLMPLSVGRPASVLAVEAALETDDKEIVVVPQRDPPTEAPTAADLYTIGTRASIRKTARTKDGHIEVLVYGVERVVFVKIDEQ